VEQQCVSAHRLVVANRGEIAVRIIRAASQLGIETIALYEPADQGSLHCRLATATAPLSSGGYLSQEQIIGLAREMSATLIHPGYGFLAENADFAEAVSHAGIRFVGPSAAAIRAMGDKVSARALMVEAGVPVVPGVSSIDTQLIQDHDHPDTEALRVELEQIGYPIMVKASAGGGGKGMRLVEDWDSFASHAASAAREAGRSFANDTIYAEKYIANPKHIEVQIFGTPKGIFHLGERECSIQRRHQKVIEECPSPSLTDDERAAICKGAVQAAAKITYQNAGTVECLFDSASRQHYFLEMNTRLQVEHPVTEWCTGVDLVQLQILLALGAFPTDFIAPTPAGHAIECRIYAEDPISFIPAPGKIERCIFPHGPGVRVDTAITGPAVISSEYDPQVAKISCWGETRVVSIQRMKQALSETILTGLTHNIPFLIRCLEHKVFIDGDYDTSFGERYADELHPHRLSGASETSTADFAAIAVALGRLGVR